MNSTDLYIAFCSYKAAEYAVKNWHYSKSMPAGRLVRFGVWENKIYKGCVLLGLGACQNSHKPYNLKKKEVCELVRIALKNHINPVTRILAICLKLFKKHCPGIKLIISFADENQGHLGKIYQASNWYYIGKSTKERGIKIKGRLIHRRTIGKRYNTSNIEWLKANIDKKTEIVKGKPKHKYVYPLDSSIIKICRKLKKENPK